MDFFFAKSDLAKDFSMFPHLKVADDMRGNEAFEALMESPEWATFKADNGIGDLLTDLEQQVGDLPMGLDLLDIFGGEELAIAGRFQGSSFAEADWVAYGRVSLWGKLGAALLHRGWLPVEGITVDRQDGIVRMTGGSLTRPHYMARVRDVVMVGTSHELTAAAKDLAARRGEGSLLAGADYNDKIANTSRTKERDELEVVVDMKDLLTNIGHEGEWPDSKSHSFMTSFLGKIFQAPACRKIMGVIGLREGLNVDLRGGFATELITEEQRAIYSRNGFSKADVLNDIAMVAPEDCALYVFLHGPIDILLKQVLDSMEPEMRNLLEQNFQATGEYSSLDEVVNSLAANDGLANRMALIVTENKFGTEADGPPNDGRTVFLVSLVIWYADGGQNIEKLRSSIGNNGRNFGLEGSTPGSGGYFTNVVDGNSVHEFWSQFIPGTGIVTTFNRGGGAKGRGRCYVFNNHLAAGMLSRTYTLGRASNYPRLSERPDFKILLGEGMDLENPNGLHSANVLIWWNPRAAANTLLAQSGQAAEDEAGQALAGDAEFWSRVRAEIERNVLAENWAGRSASQLDENDRLRFDQLVNDALGRRRREEIRRLAPQLRAEKERKVKWSGMMSSGLLLLGLDPRGFHLTVRSVIPVD